MFENESGRTSTRPWVSYKLTGEGLGELKLLILTSGNIFTFENLFTYFHQ